MSEGYPAKYWWVVLVAVPLVGGLIAILPDLFGGGGGGDEPAPGPTINVVGSEVGGHVQVVENQLLLEQYHNSGLSEQQVAELTRLITESQSLQDAEMYGAAAGKMEQAVSTAPSAAAFNNLGVLRLESGDEAGARAAFEEGLKLQPDYEPLQLNMARLHLRQADAAAALSQLAVAGDSGDVRALRSAVQESVAAGAIEREPNDALRQPNLLTLGQTVRGQLSHKSDVDHFRVSTGDGPRDLLRVSVDSQTDSILYDLQVRDASRSPVYSSHTSHFAQNISGLFSALPNSDYIVSISTRHNRMGNYALRVEPTRAFDDYEPNDSSEDAASMDSLAPITAGLMDRYDQDFFRLPEMEGELTVRLTTPEDGLGLELHLYSSDFTHLAWDYATNMGQNLQVTSSLPGPQRGFVMVKRRSGEGGDYRLEFERP